MDNQIPPSDPEMGYAIRIDRAVAELVEAIASSPRIYSPADVMALIDARRRECGL